ncbi:MAG: phage holin family protein [Marinosulfonomonas sp.]
MQNVTRNLKIIWRTQALISERRLADLARKSTIAAGAGIVALFGVAMLDVAAFLWLGSLMEPALAAVIVALGNFILAGLILFLANSSSRSDEIAMAREVQDIALKDIEAEAERVQRELNTIRRDFRDARAQVKSAIHDPASLITPQMLMPVIRAALKAFRKSDPKA